MSITQITSVWMRSNRRAIDASHKRSHAVIQETPIDGFAAKLLAETARVLRRYSACAALAACNPGCVC